MGAWIETRPEPIVANVATVAPYVGAWIETKMSQVSDAVSWSHPTWVRGLKLSDKFNQYGHDGVAPYVGAWIETLSIPPT